MLVKQLGMEKRFIIIVGGDMQDFEDYEDKSWSKKEILLLTYSILINIVTFSLILYIAL